MNRLFFTKKKTKKTKKPVGFYDQGHGMHFFDKKKIIIKILGEKYRQIGVSHDLDPPLFQINDRRK